MRCAKGDQYREEQSNKGRCLVAVRNDVEKGERGGESQAKWANGSLYLTGADPFRSRLTGVL